MFRKLLVLAAITTAAVAIALVAGVTRASAGYVIVQPTIPTAKPDLVLSLVNNALFYVTITNAPDPYAPTTASSGGFWVRVQYGYWGWDDSCELVGTTWHWVDSLAAGEQADISIGNTAASTTCQRSLY